VDLLGIVKGIRQKEFRLFSGTGTMATGKDSGHGRRPAEWARIFEDIGCTLRNTLFVGLPENIIRQRNFGLIVYWTKGYRPNLESLFPDGPARLLESNKVLLKAIESGDPDRKKSAMEFHTEQTWRNL
jgi:hypothetical protein